MNVDLLSSHFVIIAICGCKFETLIVNHILTFLVQHVASSFWIVNFRLICINLRFVLDLHGFTSGNITVKSVSIAACKMYMYSCLTEPIDQISHRFTIFYTLVLFSTYNLYTKAIKALYLLIFVL